jgi:LEA14-like dessication related protein
MKSQSEIIAFLGVARQNSLPLPLNNISYRSTLGKT